MSQLSIALKNDSGHLLTPGSSDEPTMKHGRFESARFDGLKPGQEEILRFTSSVGRHMSHFNVELHHRLGQCWALMGVFVLLLETRMIALSFGLCLHVRDVNFFFSFRSILQGPTECLAESSASNIIAETTITQAGPKPEVVVVVRPMETVQPSPLNPMAGAVPSRTPVDESKIPVGTPMTSAGRYFDERAPLLTHRGEVIRVTPRTAAAKALVPIEAEEGQQPEEGRLQQKFEKAHVN